MNNNLERMQFFALASLLKALCDPEVVMQFENLCSSHSDKSKRVGLLLGYKLVIKTILYRQIELAISYPRILGFQQVDEELLRWWWGPSETKYANRFHKAMRDDAPVSARIGNHINNLLLKIERSGVKPERFNDAADEVFSFARTILSMTENCRLLISIESGMTQDINSGIATVCSRVPA